MRALVVDDSRTMRTILSRILVGLDVDVELAEDAPAALERLDENHVPDIALVDWHMPGMNGLELVRAVRAQDRYTSMFIMMVTTEGEPEQIVAALAAGADEYIVKPFTAQAIAEKLSLLDLGGGRTPARSWVEDPA